MRILHLIDHMDLGGAQVILKNLFEHKKDDSSINLFVLRKSTNTIEISHTNVRASNSKRRYSLATIPEIVSFIKQKNITILHCHLLKSQVHGWLIKLIWFPKIKLVFHEHGEIYSSSTFTRIFLRLARYQVNRFIGVSNSAKDLLIKYSNISPTRIDVIYNFSENSLGVKRNLGILEGNKVLLGFVGRLCEQKGCDILINSLEYLSFNYHVLVAGEGPLKEQLIRLAKNKNVSSCISFLGFISNMEDIYERIDLLVVPSRYEPFGLVAIEAQIAGIPVVASNVIGLNEVIQNGRNGLLFESEQSEQLAHTLNEAVSNRALMVNLVNQAKIDSARFSYEVFNSELSKLYHNL